MIGVPDDRWERAPARVRRAASRAPTSTADELRELPRRSRSPQWWLPERWAFIEEVPKTSVGKFDKKVLRTRHADGELAVEELR